MNRPYRRGWVIVAALSGVVGACDDPSPREQPPSQPRQDGDLSDSPEAPPQAAAHPAEAEREPLTANEKKYIETERKLDELREQRKETIQGGVSYDEAQETFKQKSAEVLDNNGLTTEQYRALKRKAQLDSGFGQRVQEKVVSSD